MAVSNSTQTLSRWFDALVAATLLLVTAPLMLAIWIAVRWDSPGPAIFRHMRLGRGCKPFAMHKFRTMTGSGGDPEGTLRQERDRVTRLGRRLRRYRLDELPQLLDVLGGRMALVGPRPETTVNLQAVRPDERERLVSVRPGMTGPTQLEFIAEDELLAHVGDRDVVYRRVLVPAKVRRDLTWLRTRSFAGDLWILLRTPVGLISRSAWNRSREIVARVLGSGP